jgi:hypothetical protein
MVLSHLSTSIEKLENTSVDGSEKYTADGLWPEDGDDKRTHDIEIDIEDSSALDPVSFTALFRYAAG